MAVHAIVIRRGHSRDVSGDRLISPPVFGAITHPFEGKLLKGIIILFALPKVLFSLHIKYFDQTS